MNLLQIVIARAFILIPRRRRFGTVMLLSFPLASLLRVVLFLARRRPRLGTPREYVLAFLLGALDEHRIQYSVPASTDSVPLLRETAKATGALIAGTHANGGLHRISLRDLDDGGIPLTIVSAAPSFPIAGSGHGARTIAPEGAFLVAARNAWRRGEIVGSMVDTTPEDGEVFIAEPIVRLAARCGVPVFTMMSRLTRDRIYVDYREVRVEAGEDDLVTELARRFELQVSARSR